MMHEPFGDASDNIEEQSLLTTEAPDHVAHLGGRLGFVAGVIPRDKIISFERLLWRACRGNVFFKQAEIEEELEDPGTRLLIFC